MNRAWAILAKLSLPVALLVPTGDATAGPGIGFTHSEARAIALQSDGKILVGGSSEYTGEDEGLLIARYNGDGSPDLSFGGDGLVRTKLGTDLETITAIAVQPDGAIVAAGVFEQVDYESVLLRYEPDGDLDPTFDGDGIVTWSSDGLGLTTDVAIQSDGKILVAGRGSVRRYAADGSLDTDFGTAGVVELTRAAWLALQPDGHILVAGDALTRLDENGDLDATFAGDGDVSLSADASSVTLQSDGKVLVGFDVPMRLARFNADGTPDATFGVGGVGTVLFDNYRSIVVQPDGGILVSATGSDYLYARIRRCLPDGSLDMSFGTEGNQRSTSALLSPSFREWSAGAMENSFSWASRAASTAATRVSSSCRL